MNGNRAKKLRQYYRKDIRKKYKDEVYFVKRVIKPKPNKMPFWLWKSLAKIFLTDEYINTVEKGGKKAKNLNKLIKKIVKRKRSG